MDIISKPKWKSVCVQSFECVEEHRIVRDMNLLFFFGVTEVM